MTTTLMKLRLEEAMKKKAAPKHDDAKQDKKMVKKMVKGKCLK